VELVLQFPVRPLAWANALDRVVEPATIWHGMWAGSLPALDRLRRHHGGATIYDSRDVFLLSRKYGLLPGWLVAPFRTLERRWARRADAVVTVNEAYGRLLQETLGVDVAAVVRNTPPRQAPLVGPRPDLIRKRCGLPASTRIVLYQGQLVDGRGIEEGMAAILEVPDAVLALLGFGRLQDVYTAAASQPPYRGRVVVLDPVPPSELLAWTSSADVALMAIQPTTVNHRFTTPNKLWEALAVGTPMVASELPGMADVIRETGAGALCDPTSPASIANAIGSILDLAPADRDAIRDRAAGAARDRYNWETQATPLLALYAKLATLRDSSATYRLRVTDRRTQRDDPGRDRDPVRALVEVFAAQADRLAEHLKRIADEAFIETDDGRRRFRFRPGDRFGRSTDVSRRADTNDDDNP
jgi:glycosyltransferase involved in cell wall biosynthesis